MYLSLSRTCPIFQPENRPQLLAILDRVRRGWHVVASPAPDVLRELLSGETWDIFSDALLEGYKLAANAHTILSPDECGVCDPSALSDFLASPVELLVENGTNDGRFVTLMASLLRPRLGRQFAGSSPQVRILHGGGIGEVPKEIRRAAPSHQARQVGGLPIRFAVLTDSDATRRGEESEQAKAARAQANQSGVAIHILANRSIENYIPDGVLADYAWKNRHLADAVDSILKLHSEARDHYPMKDGLPEDIGTSKEHEPYYEGCPRKAGLGASFVETVLDEHPHAFNRVDVRSRDHLGDLDQFLRVLESRV
jgi:hypothetical protein